MPEFTEAEFRAWCARCAPSSADALPRIDDVRVRLLDRLHAAAKAGVTVTRLKVTRGEFLAIAAAVGPLPTPEATYAVCGVPIAPHDGAMPV